MRYVLTLALLLGLAATAPSRAYPDPPLIEQPDWLKLDTIRYQGGEVGSNNLLQLTLLNLQARFWPDPSDGPVLGEQPCWLQFLGEQGVVIQGAGRVQATPGQLFGRGTVIAPAVGTRITPAGSEPVHGFLLLPLENGLLFSGQGPFFQVGGDGSVRFGLQALFQPAGEEPCWLVGDVVGHTGEQK